MILLWKIIILILLSEGVWLYKAVLRFPIRFTPGISATPQLEVVNRLCAVTPLRRYAFTPLHMMENINQDVPFYKQ